MTAPARVIENVDYTQIESAIVAVGTTIILDGIDAVKPHCFGGVQFFDDALGETSTTPTFGTVQISVSTVNTTPVFELPPVSIIDATATSTINWSANTQAASATPNAIAGASFYRLIVTCNKT